jgi:hypothetical protein
MCTKFTVHSMLFYFFFIFFFINVITVAGRRLNRTILQQARPD